jgi:hypothetical protein
VNLRIALIALALTTLPALAFAEGHENNNAVDGFVPQISQCHTVKKHAESTAIYPDDGSGNARPSGSDDGDAGFETICEQQHT